MKPILLIAVFYAVINAAVVGALGMTLGRPVPTLPVGPIEPRTPRSDIVLTLEELGLKLLLDSAAFAAADRPQLVVFGASGATDGFRPELLQPELPGYQVSSLAMGGANVTEMKQALDEFLWSTPTAIVRRSVAVFAIGYNLFVKDGRPAPSTCFVCRKHPHSDITRAARRNPAILDACHPLRSILPRRLVLAAKQRLVVWRQLNDLLPWNLGDWLARKPRWRAQTAGIRSDDALAGPIVSPPPPLLPAGFDTWPLKEQVASITKWLGPGSEVDRGEQEMFTACLRDALQAGMQVVVLDMPLPSIHREEAPLFATFKPTLGKLVAPFLSGGDLAVVDLTDAIGDEHFQDLAHAKRGSRAVWTRAFIEGVRPVLRRQSPRTRE